MTLSNESSRRRDRETTWEAKDETIEGKRRQNLHDSTSISMGRKAVGREGGVRHLNVGERIPHPLCQRSHVVAFFDDDHVLLFVQNGANGTDYYGCPCSEGLQELGFDGGKKRGGGSEGGRI